VALVVHRVEDELLWVTRAGAELVKAIEAYLAKWAECDRLYPPKA
jgi:hypothetical protein